MRPSRSGARIPCGRHWSRGACLRARSPRAGTASGTRWYPPPMACASQRTAAWISSCPSGWTSEPLERGGSAGAGDVGLQRGALQLDLVEPVLDDVADADEAGELAVAEHRQVADAPLGHEGHQVRNPILRAAGDHGLGHQLLDAALEQSNSVAAEPVDDVPL